MLGTLLGIGAFVTVLGVTATANGQIASTFTKQAATELDVRPAAMGITGDGDTVSDIFPSGAEQRVNNLHGVVNVTITADFKVPGSISKFPKGTPVAPIQANIKAVTPSYWQTVHARLEAGRTFSGYIARTPVAVVSARLANRLGVADVAAQPIIFLNGAPFTVVGIIDEAARDPEAVSSVLVPMEAAERRWGAPQGQISMIVETAPGAAPQLGAEVPVAIDAYRPSRYTANSQAEPTIIQDRISGDLSALFLILAAVCLVIGGVGIANTTLVAVMERTSEIGLRRALGAKPRHILAQFLLESATLGSFGGLFGMAVGVLVVVTIAATHDWTAIVAPWTLAAAPVGGLAIGLLAGLYPAVRASRVEPVVALGR